MATMQMSFPAIKGQQGKREYYVAMFPLGVISRLFQFTDYAELPAEQRAQRVIARNRIPAITKYILDNEDGWVFSSLTASFTADETFTPSELDPAIGILHLPLDITFLINDGQHRRAAIEEALKHNKQLEHETISVVLFPREDLDRDQQIFSDLNRTVQKTSRSLDILYDHRDPMNSLTMAVGEQTPVFRGRVEKDRVSLSARSARFVTLSSLYDANVQLLGRLHTNADEDEVADKTEQAIDFWKAVTENIPDWRSIARRELTPQDMRAESITATAVVLWALGSTGRALSEQYPDSESQTSVVSKLSDIDWRKTNPDWQGICMLGPDVVTRRQTKEATAHYIKWCLGLTDTRPVSVLAAEAVPTLAS